MTFYYSFHINAFTCHVVTKKPTILTKVFGLQWQGASSKDVSREYRVRFSAGTTLDQCACLYVWAGLVAHHWWVRNWCERKKI